MRYGPYLGRALNVTKHLILQNGFYDRLDNHERVTDPRTERLVQDASTVSELYEAMGSKWVSVVVPCKR